MNNSTIGLITIPATVRAIGKNAFSYSRITGINFLGNTITIDASAFYYCTRLKGSITLPSGIYGARAFYNCIELESDSFIILVLHNTGILFPSVSCQEAAAHIILNENTYYCITHSTVPSLNKSNC